ncbi:MAG: LEA type 2 family protein [Actinomycetota bacterium]
MARWFMALLALVLTSCAGAITEPPEVSLVDLRPVEVNLFEQRMAVVLRIRNPNDGAISVDGYRFAVELNGKPFAKGMSSDNFTVPRLGEATSEASATVSTADLVRQAVGAPKSEKLAYRVHGTLFVPGWTNRNVPFDQTGEIDFGAAR